MILSASRRTDIPAFYSDWFINRLKAGYVLVPNPMNANHFSKVPLTPELVDCIVFWTKNPEPMLDAGNYTLVKEMGYRFYTQFTVTPYDKDVEPGLPDKQEIIDNFCKLAELYGKESVDWRYDPIITQFFNKTFPVDWHIEQFEKLCGQLSTYTTRCVISFVDLYRKAEISCREVKMQDIMQMASAMGRIAKEHKIKIQTCAESVDLSSLGIEHGACIDKQKIEEICGYPIKIAKDATQRPECGCAQSVDIGTYNTCRMGCAYCYASSNWIIKTNKEDADSLVGDPYAPNSKISDCAKAVSLKDIENMGQTKLF